MTDVFVHIRHQPARLILPGTVLFEEVVEGEDQRALTGRLGAFADLAEALLALVEGEAEVKHRVGIVGEGLEFGVPHEDQARAPDLETPRPWI